MQIENIKNKTIELIDLLDKLLAEENFSAYRKIKEQYSIFLGVINEKNSIESKDFQYIQNSFRLLLEAPPRNVQLAHQIMLKMEEIYDAKR